MSVYDILPDERQRTVVHVCVCCIAYLFVRIAVRTKMTYFSSDSLQMLLYDFGAVKINHTTFIFGYLLNRWCRLSVYGSIRLAPNHGQ